MSPLVDFTKRVFASRSNQRSHSPSKRRPDSDEDQRRLVGSALERQAKDIKGISEKIDTGARLEELRRRMVKDNLQYYVIPSEDVHMSKVVASADKRREFISGFSGSAGLAVVSKTSAYLITDSRYWLQAQRELDSNWQLIRAGAAYGPTNWMEWLVDRTKHDRIGMDARMISHEDAILLQSKLSSSSKLIFPSQNLVDLIWKDRPRTPKDPVYMHVIEFTGKPALDKLRDLRKWIRTHPAAHATLISSLPSIAWLLNLRGSDVPFDPLFHAYLFVGLDHSILFINLAKLTREVAAYLTGLGIDRREYSDLWEFLRRREWGRGEILVSPETSYAISLILTRDNQQPIVRPSYVEREMAIQNDTEIEGMRRAHLRDGASFVQFFAWLETKLDEGYSITEWEATMKLSDYRRQNQYYIGVAHKPNFSCGPNTAIPHYSPIKSTASQIDRDTLYLTDSAAYYMDGLCDTTRTIHLGRPTREQCNAYTRVLRGHIAIDKSIFPEGTSGFQLDVLARAALWDDGLNYLESCMQGINVTEMLTISLQHGTGQGFGSSLKIHEGVQCFSHVPLYPGNVITTLPGFYYEGKWGMRIGSTLVVRRVQTRGMFSGDIWLGFERLTCVPIQTRMVEESMLTKVELKWLKEHNKRCLEKLTPLLKHDKRALEWLRREVERSIGIPPTGPGGIPILP